MDILCLVVTLATLCQVSADYDCLCSYAVETVILDKPVANSNVLGYMYEFDCKPIYKDSSAGDKYEAVGHEHKLGYILLTSETQTQICQGSIPYIDQVFTTQTTSTTTTTTTVPPTTSTEPTTTTTEPTTTTTAPTTTPLTTIPSTSTIPTTTTTVPSTTMSTSTTTAAPSTTTTTASTMAPTTSTTTRATETTTIQTTKASTTLPTTPSTTMPTTYMTTTPTPTTKPMTTPTPTTKPTTTPTPTTKPTTTPTPTTKPTTTPTPTTVPTTTPRPTTKPTTTPRPTTTTVPTTTVTSALPLQGNIHQCPSAVRSHTKSDHLFVHDTFCYEFIERLGDWHSGERDCPTRGGVMVYIRDQSDQDFITKMLSDIRVYLPVWLGLHDTMQEETWRWLSDAPLKYENWMPGRYHDNYHEKEDCALLVPVRHGQWDDVQCQGVLFSQPMQHPWICQYNLTTHP